MPQRTRRLLIILVVLSAIYPIWTFGILPRLFPQVACVIQQPNGAPIKAWGEEACFDNGMPTVILHNQNSSRED